MTAQRSRKEEMDYRRHQAELKKASADNDCAFCMINASSDQFVAEGKHFKIIQNIFPYSIWDSQPVESHLMIVPKIHTDKLGNLEQGAGEEFLSLIDKYENQGYNLYARAPGSTIKSIVHQHSHLIKPTGKRRKFVFFARKPFVRITF